MFSALASNQILSKLSQTQPDCAVLRLLDWGSLSWSTSWRGRARKGGSLKGTSGTHLASKSTGWICSEPGSTMVWPQFMAIFLVKMMMHHFCFEIPYFWTHLFGLLKHQKADSLSPNPVPEGLTSVVGHPSEAPQFGSQLLVA